jgi:hypothetical protein
MTTERLVKIGDMTFALAVLVALTVPAAAGNCLYSSSQYCSCVRAQVVHPRFVRSAEFKRYEKQRATGDFAVPSSIVNKIHAKCARYYGN